MWRFLERECPTFQSELNRAKKLCIKGHKPKRISSSNSSRSSDLGVMGPARYQLRHAAVEMSGIIGIVMYSVIFSSLLDILHGKITVNDAFVRVRHSLMFHLPFHLPSLSSSSLLWSEDLNILNLHRCFIFIIRVIFPRTPCRSHYSLRHSSSTKPNICHWHNE